MILANGRILLVGGETGSNAPPSSLEILSVTGTNLFISTSPLVRTRIICTLSLQSPCEGVLIVYYNEVRILDTVTFETTKQLPGVSGAVNNFLVGRNYPLEGTMVLLPEYAPYVENS